MSQPTKIILTILACTSYFFIEKMQAHSQKVDLSESLACGKILSCSESDYLVYSPFQSVVAGSRCIWILSIKNAYKYKINVEYLGFYPTGEKTRVETGLLVSSVNYSTETMETVNIKSPGEEYYFMATEIIFTFWTTELFNAVRRVGQGGFIIKYFAFTESNKSSDTFNKHHILSPATNEISYTESKSSGSDSLLDLSIVGLVPRGNFLAGEIGAGSIKMSLLYVKNQSLIFDQTCDFDKIVLYVFTRINASAPSYEQREVICNNENTTRIELRDLALLVLRTSNKKQWNFKLYFTD